MTASAVMTSSQNAERLAALIAACERFRVSVTNVAEITSQESRVAVNVHELGASVEDVQELERQAKVAVGATALEPLSRKHPEVAAHLESRCRFLMIVGVKAIAGRDMAIPEDFGRLALLYVFIVKAVFKTVIEPIGKACRFDELKRYRDTVGIEYFPLPLASWHMGLKVDLAYDKGTRTVLATQSKDATSYTSESHRLKLNDEELGNGIGIIRAIFQLRPLNQFLPAGFIAERCGVRYPSVPSMVARSERLKTMADELCPHGAKVM